jgi:hypothetical protein
VSVPGDTPTGYLAADRHRPHGIRGNRIVPRPVAGTEGVERFAGTTGERTWSDGVPPVWPPRPATPSGRPAGRQCGAPCWAISLRSSSGSSSAMASTSPAWIRSRAQDTSASVLPSTGRMSVVWSRIVASRAS